MNRVGMIINPSSGRKMAAAKGEDIQRLLVEAGKIVEVHHTIENENLAVTAKNLASESDIVVVLGGDGTVNQAVNGLMKLEQPPVLALYPMGTVNDFATHLQIPKNIELFGKMILDPCFRTTDIGKAGERYFINVVAGGLLPELAHRVSPEAKTVLGKFAYYLEGIKEFPKQFFHPIPIELEIKGSVEEKEILFFLAANSPLVGGFRNLVPHARIDDGLLELLVVEAVAFPDMANVFFNFMRMQREPDLAPVHGMNYYQVSEFTLWSGESMGIDVDGEAGGDLPLKVSVFPKALTIMVP